MVLLKISKIKPMLLVYTIYFLLIHFNLNSYFHKLSLTFLCSSAYKFFIDLCVAFMCGTMMYFFIYYFPT